MDNQEIQIKLAELNSHMDYLEKQIELEKQLIRSEVLNPMLAEIKSMRIVMQAEMQSMRTELHNEIKVIDAKIDTRLNSLERLVWVLFGAVVSVLIRNFF